MNVAMREELAGAPRDAVAAATHPDPCGFYARLVAEKPLYRDPDLGMWVASSAAAVTAVLTHPEARVRPATEPIPKALLGSPAERLFGHLARTTDGEGHDACKAGIIAALEAFAPARVAAVAERWAARLAAGIGPDTAPEQLNHLVYELPLHVVGSLVGLDDDTLPEVTPRVAAFVRCLFPGGTPEDTESGKVAAGELLEIFECHRVGLGPIAGPEAALANAIGLLVQAYDASAGLICATLVALARDERFRAPELLTEVVEEVLRHESPVQNTRRFVHRPCAIGEHQLAEGDAVLVLLGAANRDPAANPDPERFDLRRDQRKIFSFGVGVHACPAKTIVTAIARSTTARLLRNGFDLRSLMPFPPYRPSANCRIPLLIAK